MFKKKRENLIFLAGAETFHTLSHIVINFTDTLPIRVYSIVWDQQLNLIAIAVNAVVTVGLFWWISKTK